MEGEDLKQALKHDEAIKGHDVIPPEVMQTPVSIVTLGKQLDEKLAVLSKTVSLGFVDAARTCMMLAMQPVDSRVVTAADGSKRVDDKPPRPEAAEKWMNIAATAIDLARQADSLGDRPLARAGLAKG